MSEVNIKSPGILSQKIQEMMATNFYQMEEESKRMASEQQKYIVIVSDRKDLAPIIDESLAIVDVGEE